MKQTFADRLAIACQARKNSLCVGIDPRWELLPVEIRHRHANPSLEGMAAAFEEFSLAVLDLVAHRVPVVKPQTAFFEACGPAGMAAQERVCRRARQLGLITILDAKRNDIASTAQAYADAAFAGTLHEGMRHHVWDVDALTINPYLGRDAVEPFLDGARQTQAGLYVLVRTSNKGAGLFQDLVSGGKPIYRHVADAVRKWTLENLGTTGFGDVGAVVGATHPAELAELRAAAPEVPFLVPGYGAQGGKAADLAAAFRDDGLGAVINSSRGIIAAFEPDEPYWKKKIIDATEAAIAELRAVTPMGRLG
jgi:orotidine-5'-phosphate decarboxylase